MSFGSIANYPIRVIIIKFFLFNQMFQQILPYRPFSPPPYRPTIAAAKRDGSDTGFDRCFEGTRGVVRQARIDRLALAVSQGDHHGKRNENRTGPNRRGPDAPRVSRSARRSRRSCSGGIACGLCSAGSNRKRRRRRTRVVGLRMRRGCRRVGNRAHRCGQGCRRGRSRDHHRSRRQNRRHDGHIERPDVDAAQLDGDGRRARQPRRRARLRHSDGCGQINARNPRCIFNLWA